jgi:hypothetical protein
MKRSVFLFFIGAMLLARTPAYAHHSFAATYYEDRVVMIEGELVQFDYRNPHSFVFVMVPDKEGNPQRWAIEWGAVAQLNNQRAALYTEARRSRGDHWCAGPQRGRAQASDAEACASLRRIHLGRSG